MDNDFGNGFNIVDISAIILEDLNPDKVLFNNIGEYEKVLLLGYGKENQVLIASSFADSDGWLALLEKAKYIILSETLENG